MSRAEAAGEGAKIVGFVMSSGTGKTGTARTMALRGAAGPSKADMARIFEEGTISTPPRSAPTSVGEAVEGVDPHDLARAIEEFSPHHLEGDDLVRVMERQPGLAQVTGPLVGSGVDPVVRDATPAANAIREGSNASDSAPNAIAATRVPGDRKATQRARLGLLKG